jgi:hypothetical protein
MVEGELLSARMELDAAGAPAERALGLGPGAAAASSMTMSFDSGYPSGSCIGKTNACASMRSSDPTSCWRVHL